MRDRMHKTSLSRGSRGGEFDNRETLSRVLKQRAERAQLLGYKNHADYILENQTALTVEAVNQRLSELANPAAKNVAREISELQNLIDEEGGKFELESWDWDFYAEKLRKEKFDFDASQLRPYFELDSVVRD